jgi:uncharacterized membrane protein YeaQ/YmgE (transglycosylase-associated protein family)
MPGRGDGVLGRVGALVAAVAVAGWVVANWDFSTDGLVPAAIGLTAAALAVGLAVRRRLRE